MRVLRTELRESAEGDLLDSRELADSTWALGFAPILLLTAIILLLAMARTTYAARSGLFVDEMFTRSVVRLPLTVAWPTIRFDLVHPPLFYIIARPIVRLLPDSLLALRLLSLASGIALLIIVAAGLLCIGSVRSAVVGAVLVGIAPLPFDYSARARSYAMFAAVGCLLACSLLARRERRPQLESLLIAAMCMLHYFGAIFALMALAMRAYAWRENPLRMRHWAPLVPGVLLLGLWCLGEIPILQLKRGLAENLAWAGQPSAIDIPRMVLRLMAPFPFRGGNPLAACVLLAFVFGFALSRPWKSIAGRCAIALFVGAVVPVLSLGLAAVATPKLPIFVERHFIVSQAWLLMAVALATESIRPAMMSSMLRLGSWLGVLLILVAVGMGTSRLGDAGFDDVAEVLRMGSTEARLPTFAFWSEVAAGVSYHWDGECLPAPDSSAAVSGDWRLQLSPRCRVAVAPAPESLPSEAIIIARPAYDGRRLNALRSGDFKFRPLGSSPRGGLEALRVSRVSDEERRTSP